MMKTLAMTPFAMQEYIDEMLLIQLLCAKIEMRWLDTNNFVTNSKVLRFPPFIGSVFVKRGKNSFYSQFLPPFC